MDNLLYKAPAEIGKFAWEEGVSLRSAQEELRAWDEHNLDHLLAVMHENIIYHDITRPPAKGLTGLSNFWEAWISATPDFAVIVEQFIVQENTVVTIGKITGTMTGAFFGREATNKHFECLYAKAVIVKNHKITYVRFHWDSYSLMRQMGWAET